MYKKLSLSTGILLFFSIISIGIIVLGLETFRNNDKFKNTSFWVKHSQSVLYETEQVLLSSSEMESSINGYLLTRDRSFLVPFINSKRVIYEHITKIKDLTRDNPMQQVRVNTLSNLVRQKSFFSDTLIEMRDQTGLYAAQIAVASGKGRLYLDMIKHTVNTLQSEENRLMNVRRNLNEKSNRNFTVTFVALLIGIGLTLLTACILLWQNEIAGKKAAKLLSENRQLLTAVIDNTASGISLRDIRGRFILVNKQYAKLFSKHGNIIGKTLFDILPEKIATSVAAEDKKIMEEKKPIAFENDVVIEGKLMHFLSVRFPLLNENGDIYAIGGLASDITEMKKQSNQIQDLYDNSPSGYYSLDADATFINANKTMLKWLGYSKDELIGKPLTDILTRECLKEFEKLFLVLKEKGMLMDKEFTYIRKDGSLMPVLLNSSAEMDDNNNFLYSRSTIIDITERKKMEEELKQVNEELESFSYSISHDLKAPLRIMSGYTGIVIEKYSGQLEEDGKRMLKNVVKNAIHMARLIDDLLNFSKLGRKEVTSHFTDMNMLVKEVINDQCKDGEAEKYKITVGELGNAVCDTNLVKQVWQNLVSNAIKYSKYQLQPVIEINCEVKDKKNIYSIKDNGAGFDMKYYDKLFAVFQRLHRVTEYEGTGVGLALVQKIIQKHKGRIWAESEVDKGATFYFSLSNTTDSNNAYIQNLS